MRVLPGTQIVRAIAGHDGGAPARWRRAGAVAAALALPLAVSGIAATPASAARGGYRVSHTIPVGALPEAVAVDPAARTAYVTNDQGRSVSVIDLATNRVAHTIAVGNAPTGVAVDPRLPAWGFAS